MLGLGQLIDVEPLRHHREFRLLFAGQLINNIGTMVTQVALPYQLYVLTHSALALAALATAQLMEHRLGQLAEAYHAKAPHRLTRLGNVLTATGAALLATAGRRRAPAVVGGALTLAGALSERWAVFRAGFESANDPKHTVGPQRERLERRARR